MGNLSAIRKVAGYSRVELSEVTGISTSTLSRYEKYGDANPQRSNVKHLATVLGVPVSALTDPDPLEGLL